MWELDHKEGWALKNWYFKNVGLQKTFESPLDSKEIKPVNPKGNQLWILIGRADAEAKVPILWPPEVKSWLTGKDRDAAKDCRQEKRATEDEMVGRHQQLSGHGSEQTPGDSEGQRSLVCCSPWGCKESDVTERLNNNLPSTGSVIFCFQELLAISGIVNLATRRRIMVEVCYLI